MNLLVAGSDQVDAGKTTFSVGLLRYIDGTGFKPRAGNDHWFDHDDYLVAVSEGRLYGKDASRLAEASAADVTPEDINPVHRLWRPAPGGGAGLLGRQDREFVCDRAGDAMVVNAMAEVPGEVADLLADAIEISTVEELNEAMSRHHLPALEACAKRVAETERVVVESYADIARPLRGYEADAVAIVEPGRARIYDGARYAKACEVAGNSPREGQLEEVVSGVVELIEPRASVSLPALDSETRTDPDAVCEAYEVAYEALVAVALD
ncbi:ATPase [Haladaptatus sp. GCM10025707]|uniref:ATPase n=1 Tax=unclassified Haladaptatus TaxID=2622732 RepID=UPI0023E80300|nr:ATPase [Haladaptatus sp. QDMS2]